MAARMVVAVAVVPVDVAVVAVEAVQLVAAPLSR